MISDNTLHSFGVDSQLSAAVQSNTTNIVYFLFYLLHLYLKTSYLRSFSKLYPVVLNCVQHRSIQPFLDSLD